MKSIIIFQYFSYQLRTDLKLQMLSFDVIASNYNKINNSFRNNFNVFEYFRLNEKFRIKSA